MYGRIADEIARSDLTSQIQNAVNDAIVAYQDERFSFNESIFSFQTNGNIPAGSTYQEFYSSIDTTTPIIGGAGITNAIGLLNKIDWMFLYNGGPTPWTLDPREPEYGEWASQSGTFVGQPYEYSYYSYNIRLFPVPNNVFTIRVGGALQYPVPGVSDTTSPWTNIAERLIRSRAKFELAMHVLKDDEMTTNMDKALTEAYKQLKNRTNTLTKMGRGYVRPMYF
jgi:hypothetical protein